MQHRNWHHDFEYCDNLFNKSIGTEEFFNAIEVTFPPVVFQSRTGTDLRILFLPVPGAISFSSSHIVCIRIGSPNVERRPTIFSMSMKSAIPPQEKVLLCLSFSQKPQDCHNDNNPNPPTAFLTSCWPLRCLLRGGSGSFLRRQTCWRLLTFHSR